MLIAEDHNGKRIYFDTETGRRAVSVTTCAAAVIEAATDKEPYAGMPKHLMEMHCAEGTACHAVALNWLLVQAGWLTGCVSPPKPPNYPESERRWQNILTNALIGVKAWAEVRDVTPVLVEQPSVDWRYGIAGCPDLKALVTYRNRRVMAVVEFKFTAALLLVHRVQVRLYRKLAGYTDCRMGFLVRISRDDAAVEERPVFWDDEPELDARALCCAGMHR
jgi:hypothetical protein